MGDAARLEEINGHAITLLDDVQSLEHLQAELELMESNNGSDHAGLAHIVELLTQDIRYHTEKILWFSDK